MSILSFAGLWEGRNRTRVLLLSIVILFAIAIVDWRTKPYVSLGFLYLFPIMLTARFLPRWAVVLLALLCAALSELFSSLDPSDALIRLSFETLALAGCGLFMAELLRNRQLTQEAEERLRVLVKTSPAAIVTVDERGFIERANHAAAEPPRRWHGHSRSRPDDGTDTTGFFSTEYFVDLKAKEQWRPGRPRNRGFGPLPSDRPATR